jgi:hypothetical protein
VEIPTGIPSGAVQEKKAMCSGCAGDYSSGYDDDDAELGLSAESRKHSYEADAGRNFRGRDFEAGSTAESGGGPRDEDVENCEILVSATRIVEIRFFDSNPRQIFSLSGEQVLESRSSGDHCEARSAKYYQTPRSAARSPRKSAQVFDFHRDFGVMEGRPLLRRWAGLLARFRRLMASKRFKGA